MNKLQSIDQLVGLITEVRNLRKGFITNFYLDTIKHGIWIGQGDLFYTTIRESLFFVKKNDGFWNVFYCSTSNVELEVAIKELKDNHPDAVMMIDVVGSDIQTADVMALLEKNGFTKYCSLVRMSRISPKEIRTDNNDKVSLASVSEAALVSSLLQEFFDPKCEQIPYLEELEEYARNSRILLYKENGVVVGFVVFEMNKSTLYLRYWFVHPEHRDKKIGSVLLNRFFAEGKDTRRQLFWVITDNENAIKRYTHYGFIEENMYDYVLTNK